ncbi:LysM peptidoglycan-binding domain-containing protein [Patescibacteria group bacterium]|nr:MAG: LysM peptidoglycan-binding domain-containing protein [Patescibacteria group bacterium]
MNLKSILKSLKLHESTISMILGAIVIVVVGVLVINYFRGLETGTTLPTGETTEGSTRIRDGQTFHVVEAGDTLWTVAEKYYDSGYNWVDIASVNELTNPGQIDVDQELLIPDVESKQPTVSVSAFSGELEPISGATYTVVQGDSLWNIAVRAYGDGYRWVDLVQENELANPNLIHAGNMLVLPR